MTMRLVAEVRVACDAFDAVACDSAFDAGYTDREDFGTATTQVELEGWRVLSHDEVYCPSCVDSRGLR